MSPYRVAHQPPTLRWWQFLKKRKAREAAKKELWLDWCDASNKWGCTQEERWWEKMRELADSPPDVFECWETMFNRMKP